MGVGRASSSATSPQRRHLTFKLWPAGLLAKIKPAIDATAYTGERSSKNYAFVDAVARKNVEITVAGIRRDSPVLAEMKRTAGST